MLSLTLARLGTPGEGLGSNDGRGTARGLSGERRSGGPHRDEHARKRVAVLYNVDYEDARPENDPAWAARVEVGLVATGVAASLVDAGHDAQLVAVDGDLAGLRARLAELEADCAFNLCESLGGDARLESAVPLLLELLGIPFTGSPPEVLSFALRKDRVKQRLEAAGIPTPAGRVLSSPDEPCDLPFPLIVKPVREDGSVGIWRTSVVDTAGELARAVEAVVDHVPSAGPRRAVHRRARAQRGPARSPDAAGPSAERDRLHRPAGGRAAHRLVRREVDERVGRRPRHRARSSIRSSRTASPPGSGAPRPTPSAPSGSATTAGSTCASRPAAFRTWST